MPISVWLKTLVVCCSLAISETLCLTDAVADSALKDLIDPVTGETSPVGLWISGDYPAAQLATRVAQILIQEKLGYKVTLKGPGMLSQDAFFALMGCNKPTESNDRGCGASATYAHASVEVWTSGYSQTWRQVQEQYPETAPRNLGNMGYDGESGLFVPALVRSRAYEAEGINLEFYRDYNVSWRQAGAYFASPTDLNASNLLPCADTALMTTETMKNYLEITHDQQGVDSGPNHGSVVGRCFDRYFWYSPACRGDPTTCVTCLTGGVGWAIHEIMGKATAHNMPVAIAVANSFANYANVPKTTTNLMLYWWIPDPTFLRLQPLQITFPRSDPDGIARGDLSSAATGVSVDKHVSHDLELLAPDVVELLQGFTLTLKNMDQMMLDQLNTGAASGAVACRWLQENNRSWTGWLPQKGKCSPQFGLYDEIAEQFLERRDEEDVQGLTCRVCPSGFFSSQLTDRIGTTFICKECPSGSFQASGASSVCTPCPSGSYQNETSSSSCKRCSLGRYQDEEGSTACKVCPAGASTRLLGSRSFADCSCNAGSINAGGAGNDTFNCTPCGEGMDCPFSSSVSTLLTGTANLGVEFVPTVRKGYYATVDQPLEIFLCRSEVKCPGGAPGSCASTLQGVPCAFCAVGTTWLENRCAECQTSAVAAGWGMVLLGAMLVLYVGYFVVNLEVHAQATPFKTGFMLGGLAINTLQTLAVLGLMSVRWPVTFAASASSVQILVLDLDSMGLNCLVAGGLGSFALSVLVFPSAVIWLAFCHVISRYLRRWVGPRFWKWPYTFNTMGVTLQLGFSSMAAVSLKPMMCYRHPNGRYSMVSYSSLFCGEPQHAVMLALGLALLLHVVGFMALCSWATWRMPSWSAAGQPGRVQSFRFCTSKYRLDAYWFVVPVFCRDLGFALAVALGTNTPPAQTGVASLVLVAFLIAQAVVRPCKVPLMNAVDIAITAIFVLLLSRSIQVDVEMESEFAEVASVMLLGFMFLGLTVASTLTLIALISYRSGRHWPLDLSCGGEAEEIALALQDCSRRLMEIELSELSSKIDDMNSYDVRTLLDLISLMSTELEEVSSGLGLTNRVALNSLNRRLTRRTVSRKPRQMPECMSDLEVPMEMEEVSAVVETEATESIAL